MLLTAAARAINVQLTANAEALRSEKTGRLTDWMSLQYINDNLLFRFPSIFDA